MRGLTGAVLLSVLPIGVVPAQNGAHVGLEIGVARYHGASRDTSGSPSATYLRPDHATTYGMRFGWQLGRVGVALRAAFGTPGIAAAAPGLTFTDRTTGGVLEIVPLVGIRVARISSEGALRIEAGPALDLWDIDGVVRARLAALGAVVYDWPVAGRFSGSIRAEGSLGGSVFDAEELPPELERRPTGRLGVTLGLRYRLWGGGRAGTR